MSDQTVATPQPATRILEFDGKSIREHTARGTLINGSFTVGLTLLGFIRGFVLAGFLSPSDYGIWGILTVGLGTLVQFKQVGIGDKYIQQDEADQEFAFQKAFTLEAIFNAIFAVVLLAALPLIALAYGRWEILGPGAVMISVVITGTLQAPLWVFYRDMNFARQRLLQAAEPILGLIIAIVLAALGAGYWALVAGLVGGSWATAALSVVYSPYALRFRYEKGTVREYASFSWPLLVAAGGGVLVSQAVILMPNRHLGLTAAGAITLALTVAQLSNRIDQILSETLYPAICAARNNLDTLQESFTKSNRLALMWAVPFGVGLWLFADDLVMFGLGERWSHAIDPLRIVGLVAAVGHIGFNWDWYFRARGVTRPVAIVSWVSCAVFFAAAFPLLYTHGLNGLASALLIQMVAVVALRGYFLAQLFEGFSMYRHTFRAWLPTIPAAGLILLARLAESGSRNKVELAAEVAVYAVVTIAATIAFEGAIVREALGYLKSRSAAAPA